MQIQVFGSGCTTCKKLFELTQKAVDEIGLKAKVEYITDVEKILEMGILTSPVLAINGNPVMQGFINDLDRIKSMILEAKSNYCKDFDACDDCKECEDFESNERNEKDKKDSCCNCCK